jgi:alpha-beta hydrolase superfamily lysophospholipase
MRELFFIAIVLACPLIMMFMMRGGHVHGDAHGGHGHSHEAGPRETMSTSDLRREREELDRLIEERENEQETPTPAGGGWR